jgi:hypothetical protein
MEDTEKGYWIIANEKHLAEFKEEAENREEFEATIIAGKAGLFLGQIRGHGRIPFERAVRLARKSGIPKIMLVDTILPQLKAATKGRIDYNESGSAEIEEHIDTEATLFKATSALYTKLGPTDVDSGSLITLSYTATLPRALSEAMKQLIDQGMSEEQAVVCLAIQRDFTLIKAFEHHGLAEPVLFNEYIWRYDTQKIAHALSQLDPQHKEVLEAVIRTCETHQAYPLDRVPNEGSVLELAHGVGLLDIVEVKSADGVEKGFIFTPHLRSEEEATEFSNDLLGDVKLFLASMRFGERYSKISQLGGVKRDKTLNFVKKLIREGEAGDATPIGIDYVMLEDRGIIRVEPTLTPPGTRHKMVLLKPQVAKLAVRAVEAEAEDQKLRFVPLAGLGGKALGTGKHFTDVEGSRIKRDPYARLPDESKEATNYYLRKLRGEV